MSIKCRRYSRFTSVERAKFLGGDTFCFNSISSFQTLLYQLLASFLLSSNYYSEFHFGHKRFIQLLQIMIYPVTQNQKMLFDQIFTMRKIYITSNLDSQYSVAGAEALSHSHKLCNEKGHPFWVWRKVNGNLDNMIRISHWKESHCKTTTGIRRKDPRELEWESHSQESK